MPWIKRIVNYIRKGGQEVKDAESIINFDSKTPPSKTLTSYIAVFSTG
jgi:hypothetical protein